MAGDTWIALTSWRATGADLAGKLPGHADEFGRGTGVQAQFVDDFNFQSGHREGVPFS